jgi:hypothetical protein
MSKRPTKNYLWQVPEDSELISDGADAIRDLADDIDRDLKALDQRVPADMSVYATKTWVAAQGFATSVAAQELIRGWTGSALRADSRIIAGSSVGVVSGFNTVSIPIVAGWNPAGWVFSAVVSNGDQNAALFVPQIVALPAQNAGSAATTLVVLCQSMDISIRPVKPGITVRVNWMVTGA